MLASADRSSAIPTRGGNEVLARDGLGEREASSKDPPLTEMACHLVSSGRELDKIKTEISSVQRRLIRVAASVRDSRFREEAKLLTIENVLLLDELQHWMDRVVARCMELTAKEANRCMHMEASTVSDTRRGREMGRRRSSLNSYPDDFSCSFSDTNVARCDVGTSTSGELEAASPGSKLAVIDYRDSLSRHSTAADAVCWADNAYCPQPGEDSTTTEEPSGGSTTDRRRSSASTQSGLLKLASASPLMDSREPRQQMSDAPPRSDATSSPLKPSVDETCQLEPVPDDDHNDDDSSNFYDAVEGELPDEVDVCLPTLSVPAAGIAADEFFRTPRDAANAQVPVAPFSTLREVPRRQCLPATRSDLKVSIFSLLMDCVGKDLSRISMPVTLNEPISFLQRIAENFLYVDLLQRAASVGACHAVSDKPCIELPRLGVRRLQGRQQAATNDSPRGTSTLLHVSPPVRPVTAHGAPNGQRQTLASEPSSCSAAASSSTPLSAAPSPSPPSLSPPSSPPPTSYSVPPSPEVDLDCRNKLLRLETAQRQLWVTLFAITPYASAVGRTYKPFNPLLGETFELHHRKAMFLAEQVSHHPPCTAYHVESFDRSFVTWGHLTVVTKFTGTSVAVDMPGSVHIFFPTSHYRDHFTYDRPRMVIRNVIFGNLDAELIGRVVVTNHSTGYYSVIDYLPSSSSWWSPSSSTDSHVVRAVVFDSNGVAKYRIGGNWDSELWAESLDSDCPCPVPQESFCTVSEGRRVGGPFESCGIAEAPTAAAAGAPTGQGRLHSCSASGSASEAVRMTEQPRLGVAAEPHNSMDSVVSEKDSYVASSHCSRMPADTPIPRIRYRARTPANVKDFDWESLARRVVVGTRQVMWKAVATPSNSSDYYGFGNLTFELNEISADYDPSRGVSMPRTDSRFRPDQRALEEGDVERATAAKLRLEENQRRAAAGGPRAAKWFEFVPDWVSGKPAWVYKGGYWEVKGLRPHKSATENLSFPQSPRIF